jgi:hypothetical protein
LRGRTGRGWVYRPDRPDPGRFRPPDRYELARPGPFSWGRPGQGVAGLGEHPYTATATMVNCHGGDGAHQPRNPRNQQISSIIRLTSAQKCSESAESREQIRSEMLGTDRCSAGVPHVISRRDETRNVVVSCRRFASGRTHGLVRRSSIAPTGQRRACRWRHRPSRISGPAHHAFSYFIFAATATARRRGHRTAMAVAQPGQAGLRAGPDRPHLRMQLLDTMFT